VVIRCLSFGTTPNLSGRLVASFAEDAGIIPILAGRISNNVIFEQQCNIRPKAIR